MLYNIYYKITFSISMCISIYIQYIHSMIRIQTQLAQLNEYNYATVDFHGPIICNLYT